MTKSQTDGGQPGPQDRRRSARAGRAPGQTGTMSSERAGLVEMALNVVTGMTEAIMCRKSHFFGSFLFKWTNRNALGQGQGGLCLEAGAGQGQEKAKGRAGVVGRRAAVGLRCPAWASGSSRRLLYACLSAKPDPACTRLPPFVLRRGPGGGGRSRGPCARGCPGSRVCRPQNTSSNELSQRGECVGWGRGREQHSFRSDLIQELRRHPGDLRLLRVGLRHSRAPSSRASERTDLLLFFYFLARLPGTENHPHSASCFSLMGRIPPQSVTSAPVFPESHFPSARPAWLRG